MRKSVEIKTNPEVLKELGETSGYSVDEIAKKIKTTVEKIKGTEKGITSFTLTQIKKLAGGLLEFGNTICEGRISNLISKG